MDATSIATAGVHPGDTTLTRAFERIRKLRYLVLVGRLVTALEESGARGTALEMHRTVRDRLSRELGL